MLLSIDSASATVYCTGYPVLRNKVDFRRSDKAANKEDLNRVVTATKVTETWTPSVRLICIIMCLIHDSYQNL